MKKIYILLALIPCLQFSLNAQWIQNLDRFNDMYDLTIKGDYFFAATTKGVFRSIDNGASWMSILDQGKSELLVLGNDLFAGNDRQISRSTDNGETWTHNNIELMGVIDFAVCGNYIFAVSSNGLSYGASNCIYRSIDKGTSWVQVFDASHGNNIECIESCGNSIFASTSYGDVWQSTNNGAGWKEVFNGYNRKGIKLVASGNSIFACSGSAGKVSYSMNNGANWTEVLSNSYVTNLEASGHNIFAYTLDSGVVRSVDGGNSWKKVHGLNNRFRCLAVKDSNIIVGMAHELLQSIDNGKSWLTVKSGLVSYDIRSLATMGNKVFTGTLGGNCESSDDGKTWSIINSGLSEKSVSCFCVNGNNIFAGTDGDGVYRSSDNGESWVAINSGLPNNSDLIESLVANEDNIYTSIIGWGVFRSSDNGATWISANSGLGDSRVSSLAINGSTVLARASSGLFCSYDNGDNWVSINTGLLSNGISIGRVFVVGNIVFISTSKGIYRSTDNGTTWILSNEGLGDNYITCFAIRGNSIFVGTYAAGVFFSSDNGQNWTPINDGLTTSCVTCLTIKGSIIFAGTENGGIYWRSIDNNASIDENSIPSASISPQPVRDEATITFDIKVANSISSTNPETSIELYDLKGTLVATYYFNSISEGTNTLRFDVRTLVSGMYNVIIKSGSEVQQTKLIKVD